MFYVLFGIVLGPTTPTSRETATYLLATMACFGVMGVALFGFGVSLAMERGQGWLQVKRASPMPLAAYFLAKLFAAVVFSTVICCCCWPWESLFGGVASAPRDGRQAGRHSGGRLDSVQCDGIGDRLLRQAELGAGGGQPGLSADVVLLGPVDSAVHAAARTAECWQRSCRRIT